MTNREILTAAMEQSAQDLSCRAKDFCAAENQVVASVPNSKARKYLKLPFFCNLVSYGCNVVASVDPRIEDIVRTYLDGAAAPYRCFETPRLHLLEEAFRPFGKTICFMAEYYLPDVERLEVLACPFEVRILHPSDFADCYTPQWSNALCERRRQLDMLAAAAFDGDRMIGMAGCSADCETMWQIGIDVLPGYRNCGVASALTSRLAAEIMQRGKIPFYCAAWSNIPSARNAIRSGFRPAWVELTAVDGEKAAGFQ